jgi:hypothetical protein
MLPRLYSKLPKRSAIFAVLGLFMLAPFGEFNAIAQNAPAAMRGESKPAPSASKASAETSNFRGNYFEIKYPKDFTARPLDAKIAKEANAATFTSPDGAMSFYIYSPQWGGDAPNIALDASKEVEVSRKADKGKSSGVEGKYTWISIAAIDKSYTRIYQDFMANDQSIHWVIGMKYKSDAVLQQYKTQYAAFKASLKQLGD